VPRFGAEIETLFAKGIAANAFRGNRADRKSKAASDCFALIAAMLPSPASPSSGVNGGVAMSGGGKAARFLLMIVLGTLAGGAMGASMGFDSGGGVGG